MSSNPYERKQWKTKYLENTRKNQRNGMKYVRENKLILMSMNFYHIIIHILLLKLATAASTHDTSQCWVEWTFRSLYVLFTAAQQSSQQKQFWTILENCAPLWCLASLRSFAAKKLRSKFNEQKQLSPKEQRSLKGLFFYGLPSNGFELSQQPHHVPC